MANLKVSGSHEGLTVNAYRGDGSVLLAFDLNQDLVEHLAGFAIKCTPPGEEPFFIPNRLNFKQRITSGTTPEQRERTPSDRAPLQKFRWIHIPPEVNPGLFNYEVTAMYFAGENANGPVLDPGPSVNVDLELAVSEDFERMEVGFTRGYLSSQAYAEKFDNKPIRPEPGTIDFDTAPFAAQYEWLGFHARKMLFSFLNECLEDDEVTIDVFAYDLNEPDFIRALARFGSRLRIYLDDSKEHAKEEALEQVAKKVVTESAGAANVKIGHFGRFAHNKVVIKKKNGTPTKVLTGSANFTLRGLYVQANNVLIFDDPAIAQFYEDAFNQTFNQKKWRDFTKAPISADWFALPGEGLPSGFVSFSPHSAAEISLTRVADAIEQAQSSILFAIMTSKGTGPVHGAVQGLAARDDIFSYGVTQTDQGLRLVKPGQKSINGIFTSFAFLKEKTPFPFREEVGGGVGQVIHHKFIVVDFNDAVPAVFTGSSNLAAGGEVNNGDNLLAINDRAIASLYAVEAIRLVDHYHFRAAMKGATTAKPLMLKEDKDKWWRPYYNPKNMKFRDRTIFIR